MVRQFGTKETSCDGKVKMTSKEKRRLLLKMRNHGGAKMAYYRCQYCGFYHLGRHK